MHKARRSSYSMAFKIKVIVEAEAVENNSEIAREYGLSESMVQRWRRDQVTILSGELKMSAKRATSIIFTNIDFTLRRILYLFIVTIIIIFFLAGRGGGGGSYYYW